MLIGAAFGFLLRGNRSRSDLTHALVWGLIPETIFCAVAMYCYTRWPDWMWMYTIDPREVPVIVVAALVVPLYYLPYVLGVLIIPYTHLKGPRLPWVAFALAIVAQLAEIALLWNQYAHVGTSEAYARGQAQPLFDSPVSMVLNVSFVVIMAAVAICWWSARRALRRTPKAV